MIDPTLPGMNLAGIPPFSGFIGKLGLLNAATATRTPWALMRFITP